MRKAGRVNYRVLECWSQGNHCSSNLRCVDYSLFLKKTNMIGVRDALVVTGFLV